MWLNHYHQLIIVFLFSITVVQLTAQEKDYTPFAIITSNETLISTLEQQLTIDIQKLPAKNKKAIKEIYIKRVASIKENISKGHYFFGNEITEYFESILNNILIANPSIPKNRIHLFISRYSWPNASCLGEGSIVLNIGLIRRLENEDQVAFILCHELAHYVANHVNIAINERVEKLARLKKSKKLKHIKKQKYGQQDALLKMLQAITFENRSHSRLHEKDADALGMVFFSNTSYQQKEALRCILLLDQMDKEKYPEKLALEKLFDSPKYPFKAYWLKSQKPGLSKMKAVQAERNIDALKTHPDCQLRYDLLQKKIANNKKTNTILASGKKQFEQFINSCDFEIIQSSYDFQNYGKCLFYACQLFKKYPKNAYLKAMIGKCLYHIYIAKKNHELNNFVDPLGSQQRNYKQVLQFIYNLRLSELKKINYYFLQKNKKDFQYDEDYLYSLWLSASAMELETEINDYKEKYTTTFPNGKYINKLSN